jgi:tyrosine-protein phosphatase YwqE
MSLLSLFAAKQPQLNYSVLNTDIHSHFIPGIDDGSKSVEESLELLKQMVSCGYQRIVCTPHVQFEYYRNSRDTILPAFDLLQNVVQRSIPEMELFVAAEYLIDEGFSEHLKQGLLSFGKKKYVLVEFSFYSPYPHYRNILQEMLMKGYTPVLAHPERYGYWNTNEAQFEELRLAGLEMQVNIPSLCGYYGSDIRKRAFSLLEKGLITCAGSDVHNQHYMSVLTEGLELKQIQKFLNDAALINRNIFGE